MPFICKLLNILSTLESFFFLFLFFWNKAAKITKEGNNLPISKLFFSSSFFLLILKSFNLDIYMYRERTYNNVEVLFIISFAVYPDGKVEECLYRKQELVIEKICKFYSHTKFIKIKKKIVLSNSIFNDYDFEQEVYGMHLCISFWHSKLFFKK